MNLPFPTCNSPLSVYDAGIEFPAKRFANIQIEKGCPDLICFVMHLHHIQIGKIDGEYLSGQG
jgi:hypothetical protein